MTALPAKRERTEEPRVVEESFDSFLARNLRRAPALLGVAITFALIRSFAVRAGVVLIFAASTLLIPLSVVRPEVGLYALVVNFVNEFDTYYRLQEYVPVSLPIVFEVAVLAGILLQVGIPGRLPRLDYVQNILLAVYVGLVTLSLLVSRVPWPDNIWEAFRANFLIRPILYFFIIALIREPRDLYRLLLVFIAAHALLTMSSMSDYLQKGLAFYRVRGTLTAVNYLSYVCVATLPVLIATYLYLRDRLAKYFMLALSVVTLFVCLQTLSRSGYYALAVTLLLLTLRVTRSPRMFVVALAFSGLFYVLVPAALVERLAEIETITTTDRYYLSRIGLRMTLDNPLLGVGWHAYETVFPSYDHEQTFLRTKGPHSLYFAIAAGSGIPALLLYLSLYGVTLAQTLSVQRRYQRARDFQSYGYYLAIGIEGGLIGHFVFGLAGSYADSYYAFLLLGLAVMVVRLHRAGGEGVVLR